ncbi:MAG: hypothetical protein ACK5BY_07945 [Limnohabitans sp.]|jgi:hypothetical protein|uniref:hypothetical protein n=1 Tax=Limnohabitans sp. TaxID=1907725 RepID=UPI00391AE65E
MFTAKQAAEKGIPVILSTETHKVIIKKTDDGEIVAFVCGADGAQAAELRAYEVRAERTCMAEIEVMKLRREFHEFMEEAGLRMPEWRNLKRSYHTFRQHKKGRKKFLRQNEKHIQREQRKSLKRDIAELHKLMAEPEVKNNPAIMAVYQEDLRKYQYQLDNLSLTKQ